MTALRPDSTAALAEMIGGGSQGIGILAGWSSHWTRKPPRVEFTGLDLSALDRLLDLSAGDLTCRVEAGISLGSLTAHLDPVGLEWPVQPLPGQTRLAQTFLSGAAYATSALFPNPRDWILGGTLVSGRGEIVTTGGATVKNSAGYDLVRSCFGSMGVLAVPAQLQLRLRPRPQARLRLTAPGLGPEPYLTLLAAARRQMDVIETFQIAGGTARLGIAGPDDRVEEAAAALTEALPGLLRAESEPASGSADWNGDRYQMALPANRMAGFLADREPARYWAFPFQRLAFSQGSPGRSFPEVRSTRLLPLPDARSLRAGLALLCRGLDPDRRFV
ncbi:MAG: FAD-binding oxidoreductase [Chloroflexi bacterium]|nr:FAD-binding oxidoreductase [Chloroflexota bacterium]